MQFALEVAKTRSHGSWPPFGAVQRFWMFPPVELDSHDERALDTSNGKFVCVPDAIEAVEVTVIERAYRYDACAWGAMQRKPRRIRKMYFFTR